jgi:hypothetical protein
MYRHGIIGRYECSTKSWDRWYNVGGVGDILSGAICRYRTVDNPSLIPKWAFACAPLC